MDPQGLETNRQKTVVGVKHAKYTQDSFVDYLDDTNGLTNNSGLKAEYVDSMSPSMISKREVGEMKHLSNTCSQSAIDAIQKPHFQEQFVLTVLPEDPDSSKRLLISASSNSICVRVGEKPVIRTRG